MSRAKARRSGHWSLYLLLAIVGAAAVAALTMGLWLPRLSSRVDVAIADVEATLVDRQGRPMRLDVRSLLQLPTAQVEVTADVVVTNPLPLGGRLVGIDWVLDLAGDEAVATGHAPLQEGFPIVASGTSTFAVPTTIAASRLRHYADDVLRERQIVYRIRGTAHLRLLATDVAVPFDTGTETLPLIP